MITEKNKSKVFLILTILMTLTIWFNSLLPANISSTQSGFFTTMISSFLSIFNITIQADQLSLIVRKSAHFAQFFLLGIFWFQYLYSVMKNQRLIHWLAILFCLLTAIIDESIQLFTDGRAFQFTDILIDLFGSIMAILAFVFTMYLIKRKGESA